MVKLFLQPKEKRCRRVVPAESVKLNVQKSLLPAPPYSPPFALISSPQVVWVWVPVTPSPLPLPPPSQMPPFPP